MAIERILIVDDEDIIRDFVAETLRRENLEVVTAENGKRALSLFKEKPFDLVFTDMKMPDLTGIEVLKKIKELEPNTIVVVITGHASVENAVEAMTLGAFNYLIKPFSPDTIEAMVKKANEHFSLVQEHQYLKDEAALPCDGVIAESAVMRKILKDVSTVAQSNASVFISGESGTGKEVIAQAIHSQSLRIGKPFIKVNCAAVPEALLESEFFGHEKGAFTGANAKRLGRFELAHEGTLMLDEVTEIPLTVQAKLLRAIQEQVFERVGGTKSVKVDVRLISTSNRDMKEAIDSKIMREDLFYRLNVVPIHLPPLRERPDDIIPLSNFFLKKLCLENHKESMTISSEAQKKLLGYNWPGNVRELANIIERAVVMNTSDSIKPEHIFLENSIEQEESNSKEIPVGISLQELEKRLIIETLENQKNNKTKTAAILGITTRTLRNKINEYNL